MLRIRTAPFCVNRRSAYVSHGELITDVITAVEMSKDAFADRFDTALLLSADSDLTAAVEIVRSLFESKRIVVGCPSDPKRLESVAHAYFRIGRPKPQDIQLLDEMR